MAALHAHGMQQRLGSSSGAPRASSVASSTPRIVLAPASSSCLSQQQQHMGARRFVSCNMAQEQRGTTATTEPAPAPPPRQAAGSAERGDAARRGGGGFGLGDTLGPIGLTLGGELKAPSSSGKGREALVSGGGVELGPIGMTFGGDTAAAREAAEQAGQQGPPAPSIATMTTAEWRAKYEQDGMVDLWVEEEFNAGSRLVGGRAVHLGGVYGFRTGEGPTAGDVPVHKVKIYNHYQDTVIDVEVPEDRYILWEAEDKGLELPYACRMGCCTACAVRIKEGEMYQPEALGISEELKRKGYALMCVGFPSSDLVIETVPEDEVYELQFGESFATMALDPNNPSYIERDDYALSVANMDE